MANKMCSNCGDIYSEKAWKNCKVKGTVSYRCPGCGTKHHWKRLKDVKPSDL